MKEHNLLVQKTSRYFTLGDLQSSKRIYVIHGYGQLASYFIQKFEPLVQMGWCVIAPEGLHRFYTNGHSGRIGASWMTREDRLNDIKDYTNFLNTLHNELPGNDLSDIRVLGFSQGVATAFRWLDDGQISCKQMILCSGMIPPEMSLKADHPIFGSIKLIYISGSQDEFIEEPEVQRFIQEMKSLDLPLKSIEFDGGHTVNINSVIEALLKK